MNTPWVEATQEKKIYARTLPGFPAMNNSASWIAPTLHSYYVAKIQNSKVSWQVTIRYA